MKHDIFDLKPEMTPLEIAWRVALLSTIIVIVMLDLFVWRP